MKTLKLLLIITLALSFLTACGGNQEALTADSPENSMLQNVTAAVSGDELTISFDFEKQSGWASNQFAVWIEDADGGYLQTLYATRYTANGGYKSREEALPEWVNRSGLTEKTQSEIDVISSATPSSGSLNYTWDLTGADEGEYRFFVEGNLRWGNRVMFSGTINVGDDGNRSAMAETEYIYQ
ncbi:MAG: DUF2271 domain-containing protein [Oscillospiraceae bacterium]|nr:DUF2271 domain-containing protein [Oscillospiraceae bacterium]